MRNLEYLLRTEIDRLNNELTKYMWKSIETAPKGRNILLYMEGGTMIQGHSSTGMATHWCEKLPSPNKQRGELK